MFTRILVPLDGSALAESALGPATEIARKFDAEIILLHILEDAAIEAENAEFYISKVQQSLDRGGVKSRSLIVPAEADHSQIVRAAASQNVSLIVMSTHGRTGRRTLEEGSVAVQVLSDIHIPVLFAKPSEYRQM